MIWVARDDMAFVKTSDRSGISVGGGGGGAVDITWRCMTISTIRVFCYVIEYCIFVMLGSL